MTERAEGTPAGSEPVPIKEFYGPDEPSTWHRVHPISPLVKGWIGIVAVIVIFGRGWFEDFLIDGSVPEYGSEGKMLPLLVLVLVIVGVVLIMALSFFLAWYFTRYQVTDDHVRVNSGVIFRQNRQARLDRVQAIDVVQPLLARAFSLAELKFEVADAGSSAVRLNYLKLDEAQRLRATILARAAGVETDPDADGDAPEAPETQVLALSPGRVVGATLLSGSSIFLVLAVVTIVIFAVVLDTPVAWAAFGLPALFGIAATYWTSFSNSFNFLAAISPDGIRLRYGLLETRAQTVPPGRVQAVGIVQSPLWRITGWYKMQVNVAGYGVDTSGSGARTTLLPAGTIEEVMQMLALVLPDPGVDEPFEVFRAGVDGRDEAHGFVTTPRRGRLLSLLSWRRNGFFATRTALICRSGWLWHRAQIVPHERIQSLSLHQGPLNRRFRLADVELHSTPGPVTAKVWHADLDTARLLFDEQSERAAAARQLSAPEHWMAPREQAPDSGADLEPAADLEPGADDERT